MEARQFVRGDPPDPWRFEPGGIGDRLGGYDIVALQEVFVVDAARMTAKQAYQTKILGPGARSATELGSGVEILSQLPRDPGRRVVRHHYASGTGWDAFAAKGVLLVFLRVGAGVLAVAVTHLQAGHAREATRVRGRQIRELREAIDRHASGQACLILGDLNVDGDDPDDPGTDLVALLFGDFRDAARESGTAEATWNPRTNDRATGGTHRYDFILCRSGEGLPLEVKGGGLAMTERVRERSLSDHFGVWAEIEAGT
jgi:endonuclease/exonuclease/phosphatase family metal-dependent hydrolase